MGSTTHLILFAELKKDIPQEIWNVLNYLRHENHGIEARCDHEFFECERWFMVHIDIIGDTLYSDCEFKNYHSEIDKFVNWISPYLEEGQDIIGCYQGQQNYHYIPLRREV